VTFNRIPVGLGLLLLCGLAVRAGVAWQRHDELSRDVDAYFGIAEGLATGRGYSASGTDSPTAYRPPLYPLLLAASPFADRAAWVALTNVLLGTATIGLTWLLGQRLGGTTVETLFAATLVAFDPMLVRYTSLPMTETFCTFLVTWLLVELVPGFRGGPVTLLTNSRWLASGAILGLSALCRPTVWAFALLFIAAVLVTRRRESWRGVVLASLGCLVVVAPWAIRNAIVFGRPIVTTTHGGYTLLLGNNPAYWREVVEQPWGTVWNGSRGAGQAVWFAGIQNEMQRAGIEGELAQDEWLERRARRHIEVDPAMFLRAGLRRLRSFWSVAPGGDAAAMWPPWLRIAVATFYVLLFGTALIGLLYVARTRDAAWVPPLLMVAAFCGVHLVYWSDARMRAPVVPVVALLSAHGGVWIGSRISRRGNRFG
jgi:hypothetical protein